MRCKNAQPWNEWGCKLFEAICVGSGVLCHLRVIDDEGEGECVYEEEMGKTGD